MTRALRKFGLATSLALLMSAPHAQAACKPWPAWEAFKKEFVSGDGRVIDPMHADQRTVSEGQAYAAMFALIANDRAMFDRSLEWTRNNLARGDLNLHLPAWLWGKLPDDKGWGVIDANAASDADVWLAYALLEASRLWSDERYRALGEAMATNIARYEIKDLPNLGRTLMPAPHGFVHKDYVRLNPSYLALQPLRRFAKEFDTTLWNAVIATSRRVLVDAAPQHVAGDWVEWNSSKGGFRPDQKTQGIGSYDAIRVYLWLGMLDAGDPDRRELLAHYAPIRKLFSADGRPPEFVDIATSRTRGLGPGGFSASFVPFFSASGDFGAVAQQQVHLAAQTSTDSKRYYDQVLRLWGVGWDEGRYRFGADGSLQARWSESCGSP